MTYSCNGGHDTSTADGGRGIIKCKFKYIESTGLNKQEEEKLKRKPLFARMRLQLMIHASYRGKPLVPRSDWDELIVTKIQSSFMDSRLSMRYICGPAG